MRKTILLLAIGGAASCASPTSPQVPLPKHPVVHPANHDLECGSCTDQFGRSGYIVSIGRCEAC